MKTIEILLLSGFVLFITKYTSNIQSDKRIVVILIFATCWIIVSKYFPSRDIRESNPITSTSRNLVAPPSHDFGNLVGPTEGQSRGLGNLGLRPSLYNGLSRLQQHSVFAVHSPGKFKSAIRKLDDLFHAVDKGMLHRKGQKDLVYMRLELQRLRDMRSDALNSLHSLHYSVTNKKLRKKLYDVIQLARLESLRSLSSLVNKNRLSTLRPFEFDLDAPVSANQSRDMLAHSDIFI